MTLQFTLSTNINSQNKRCWCYKHPHPSHAVSVAWPQTSKCSGCVQNHKARVFQRDTLNIKWMLTPLSRELTGQKKMWAIHLICSNWGTNFKERAKFNLEQAMKTQSRSRGTVLLFLSPQVGGQCHTLFVLPLGNWYPPYRRPGGPQGWSKLVQNISHPPGTGPQTVQPVAIHYIGHTIPAHI